LQISTILDSVTMTYVQDPKKDKTVRPFTVPIFIMIIKEFSAIICSTGLAYNQTWQ